MKTDYRLLFQNPVLRDGNNVTVRVGTKWATRLNVGDEIGLEGHKEPAIIDAILVCALWLIPDTFLYWEHDPECRTRDGLFGVLQRVYGIENDDVIVTVLAFRKLGNAITG